MKKVLCCLLVVLLFCSAGVFAQSGTKHSLKVTNAKCEVISDQEMVLTPLTDNDVTMELDPDAKFVQADGKLFIDDGYTKSEVKIDNAKAYKVVSDNKLAVTPIDNSQPIHVCFDIIIIIDIHIYADCIIIDIYIIF